jgi:hypothetical protein
MSNYSVEEIPVTHPDKVLTAIRAARNIKKWGYYAALRYCEKRGVKGRVLDVAIVCENELKADEEKQGTSFPTFLQPMAY